MNNYLNPLRSKQLARPAHQVRRHLQAARNLFRRLLTPRVSRANALHSHWFRAFGGRWLAFALLFASVSTLVWADRPFFEEGARPEAHRAGADKNCYRISGLTLETRIAPMREWLTIRGARVRVSATVVFMLYIPPQRSEQVAAQVLRRFQYDKSQFTQAKIIKHGLLKNGIDLGQFSKWDLEPLVDLLLDSGYAPGLKPVYNDRQQPSVRVSVGDAQIDARAFERAFEGHRLIAFPNCNML